MLYSVDIPVRPLLGDGAIGLGKRVSGVGDWEEWRGEAVVVMYDCVRDEYMKIYYP